MKNSELLIYQALDGKLKIDVRMEDETVWLTQAHMSELFGKSKKTISEHIQNIFKEGELDQEMVVRKFRTTTRHGAMEGKTQSREVNFYNLDVIISVGYRVKSQQGTRFRIWATQRLKEYMIKGFVMDDERLKKGGTAFGKDYFEELLERIREIRASERRFYQKITDIYALSADYNKNAAVTKDFFATVQNKLHWAITGKTAAEIIYDSADAEKLHMGLTNWKQGPDGKILKSDVTIAKNYLSQAHLAELNQIITAYLDLAENRAKRGILMKMNDWVKFLNDFLELSSYPILQDKGKVSALQARLKAEKEYDQYRVIQDQRFESDFDREVKRITGKEDEE